MAQEARSTGVVRWFSDVKGYGFIKPDDGGDDLFVHQSSIKSDGFRTLSEGATVEYTFAYGDDKKPKAVDVTGLDGSSVQEVHGDSSQSFGSRRGPGFGGGWQRDTGGDGYGYGGGRGGGGGGCYQCGRSGHLARECPESSSFGGGGGGGGGGCYNCGQPGHFARECQSAVGGGGSGGGGGAACYSCGGFGHLARDCSQGSGGGGGGGNFSRYGGGAGGGGGGCYNCGNPGHFARECTNRS